MLFMFKIQKKLKLCQIKTNKTFQTLSLVSHKMLAGLRSRWAIPLSWRYAIAVAMSLTTFDASTSSKWTQFSIRCNRVPNLMFKIINWSIGKLYVTIINSRTYNIIKIFSFMEHSKIFHKTEVKVQKQFNNVILKKLVVKNLS